MANTPPRGTHLTGEIPLTPELIEIRKKAIILDQIETLLKRKYPEPRNTNVWTRLIEKNSSELQKFLELEQNEEREEREAPEKANKIQELQTELESITENPAQRDGLISLYQEKDIKEIDTFIKQIQFFKAQRSGILEYLNQILKDPTIHHLEDDTDLFHIKEQCNYFLQKDNLAIQFLKNPKEMLEHFDMLTKEVDYILEKAQQRYLREKIDKKIETWDDDYARISPEQEKILRELLTNFSTGITTDSGLLRLDGLLRSLSPDETEQSVEMDFPADGRLVKEIIDEFRTQNHLDPHDTLESSPVTFANTPATVEQTMTTEPPDKEKTAKLNTIEYTPATEEERRKAEIYKAFKDYKSINQTIEADHWQDYEDITKIYEENEHDEGKLTSELSKIRFPAEAHYLIILHLDNPLANLKLTEEEISRLPKDSVPFYNILKEKATLTYCKSSISSSTDIPTEIPKPIPGDYRATLRAYIQYNHFEQKTGKIERHFDRLILELEDQSRIHRREAKPFWVMEKSSYDIERKNALLFLEHDWAEYDGDQNSWIEKNVNFRTGETPACVSIASMPLIPGKEKPIKQFIRFHRYPINYEKVPEFEKVVKSTGAKIEHFFIHTELSTRGTTPVIIDAKRSFIPIEISENDPNPIQSKDKENPTANHEFILLGIGYNEASLETIRDTLLNPGNYFTKENRFACLSVVAIQYNGITKFYTHFFKTTNEATAINPKLKSLGITYEVQNYPLEKTYQDEYSSYSTVTNESTIELGVYQALESAGFSKCPEAIYEWWNKQGKDGKENISSCFSDGTALTVVKVENPKNPNEHWIFVRTERTHITPMLPEGLGIKNYTIEHFIISARDGLVATIAKETRKNVIDLSITPERQAQENFEKNVRRFNRDFNTLRELNRELNELRHTQGIVPEIKDNIEKILTLNKQIYQTEQKKTLEEQFVLLLQAQDITNQTTSVIQGLIDKEKDKIKEIIIPEKKPKPSFWKKPWAYAAATVLAGFMWVASKFLPENTISSDNKNVPEASNNIQDREPLVIKVGTAIRDAGLTQTNSQTKPRDAAVDYGGDFTWEINEASVAEPTSNYDLGLGARVIPDAAKAVPDLPLVTSNDDKPATVRSFESKATPSTSPALETAKPQTIVESASALPPRAEEDMPQIVRTFLYPHKAEAPKSQITVESVLIKPGDTTIGLVVSTILKKEPQLNKIDVRRAVAQFALANAAHSSIKEGNSLQFDYSITPEGKLRINSIEQIKTTKEVKAPTQTAETKIAPQNTQVETKVEKSTATDIHIGAHTYKTGDIIEYIPLASQPGNYKIIGLSEDGKAILLKNADKENAPQFAVNLKNAESRVLSPETRKFSIDGLRFEMLPGDAYNVHFTTLSGKGVIEALATLILHTDYTDDSTKLEKARERSSETVRAADKEGHIVDTFDPTIEYIEIPDTVLSTDSFVVAWKNNQWVIESAHFSRGKTKKIPLE